MPAIGCKEGVLLRKTIIKAVSLEGVFHSEYTFTINYAILASYSNFYI